MNNQQMIAASEELGKCEGMEYCPWYLVEYLGDVYIAEEPKKDYGESKGKFMPIGFGWRWCSAKFLARAGFDGDSLLLFLHCIISESRLKEVINLKQFEQALEDLKPIREALKEGNLELAFVLTIIQLHEVDRESYNLGLEPLLGE
jgi:hypothetical protein